MSATHPTLRTRIRDGCDSLFAPETDWIQVEVSSYCNAACVYCPHTVYRDAWIHRYLSLEMFERLLPAIANTRLVFLQGWGEPFLNPDLFTMFDLAKQAGCRVGTTTNGMLLNRERIKRLLECGVDIISFSLAGVDQENDRIRRGTRLATVLDAIRTLRRERELRDLSRPAIHVSYLLLRSGLTDLAALPDALAGRGIDLVVISTLDFVPHDELGSEALYPRDEKEYRELRALLDRVQARGEDLGLRVRDNLGPPKGRGVRCSENARQSFYVSSDGSISPCVFTNLPVASGFRGPEGEEPHYRRLEFGNICEQSVSAIWQRKEYTAFRKSFQTGSIDPACRGCRKLQAG